MSAKIILNYMNWISVTGLITAVFTSTSFLPQALKTIRTKDTSSISLYMYILFTFGTLMWFIYGLATNNLPVWLANGFTLILASVILYFKLQNTSKYSK
jgi:MtN3 and saliva related transmembrane protein